MSECSHKNKSIGARYLYCVRNSFCGTDIYLPLTEKQFIILDDPKFSASNMCVYEFKSTYDATLGDLIRVEID